MAGVAGTRGSLTPLFGVICCALHGLEIQVETNQYLNLINDLQRRSEELRGYL
jgi:hypothetical protein